MSVKCLSTFLFLWIFVRIFRRSMYVIGHYAIASDIFIPITTILLLTYIVPSLAVYLLIIYLHSFFTSSLPVNNMVISILIPQWWLSNTRPKLTTSMSSEAIRWPWSARSRASSPTLYRSSTGVIRMATSSSPEKKLVLGTLNRLLFRPCFTSLFYDFQILSLSFWTLSYDF